MSSVSDFEAMDVKSSVTKIVKDRNTLISILIAVLAAIIGIILICSYQTIASKEATIDYTNCTDINLDRCSDASLTSKPCICHMSFEIADNMEGEVTLYYYLKTYNQLDDAYVKSKDEHQLHGHISPQVSPNCGNYSYEGGKPIAPCGAIADSMFNDTYKIMDGDQYYLSLLYSGLDGITEEDKMNFRNPPGDLKTAFQNFSKPRSWQKNIWELNTWEDENTDMNNTGFQNEAFIAWMKTDLQRKPSWRLNRTGAYEHGLPKGNYTMRISYAYPYSLYSGQRLLILSEMRPVINYAMLWIGIVLLAVGLIAVPAKLIYNKKTYHEYVKPVDQS